MDRIEKRHFLAKARKRERRRLRHKRKRKSYRKSMIGFSHKKRSSIRAHKQRQINGYNDIYAPSNFSFNENPEGVIEFLNNLQQMFGNRAKTYVVMENVEKIDHGAIIALLAQMVKFKANDVEFNGNMPGNPRASAILIESGFFINLSKKFEQSDRYILKKGGKNEILTHGWKKVDPALGAEVIKAASKTIWGEDRRCQGVQRALLELMHNTNNHAEIGTTGQKHWWLYANHDEENNVVGFAFIDFGVGVFTSLNNKPEGSTFWNWMEKIYKRVAVGDNAVVLKLILDGEFHQSVTGKPYRGKGLPGIADAYRRGKISALRVITNDTFAAPGIEKGEGEYRKLRASFSGTYVYWELGRDNDSCL